MCSIQFIERPWMSSATSLPNSSLLLLQYSIDRTLVALWMTACLILRLACRLLVVTRVPTAITDLCRLAHLGLRRSTKVGECIGKHVLVHTLRWPSGLWGHSELTSFVRTTEIAMWADHVGRLLLVEHLELTARLLVPYTFHEGLWSTEWSSLLRLLCKCSQLSSKVDGLILWWHVLLLTCFVIKFELYVATHAALVLRSLVRRIVAEAHWIHQCLIMAATGSRLLRLSKILGKCLSRIKVCIVHLLWNLAALLVNIEVISSHIHISNGN